MTLAVYPPDLCVIQHRFSCYAHVRFMPLLTFIYFYSNKPGLTGPEYSFSNVANGSPSVSVLSHLVTWCLSNHRLVVTGRELGIEPSLVAARNCQVTLTIDVVDHEGLYQPNTDPHTQCIYINIQYI